MTNLSTLLKDGTFAEEIKLMEEIDSDLLVHAPEAAVRNILGFASSYTSLPSILLDEIEIFKN